MQAEMLSRDEGADADVSAASILEAAVAAAKPQRPKVTRDCRRARRCQKQYSLQGEKGETIVEGSYDEQFDKHGATQHRYGSEGKKRNSQGLLCLDGSKRKIQAVEDATGQPAVGGTHSLTTKIGAGEQLLSEIDNDLLKRTNTSVIHIPKQGKPRKFVYS